MDPELRADIGDIFKNYLSIANPLNSLLAGEGDYGKAPSRALRLHTKDDINYALWNLLGTASWLVPTVGLGAWLVNRKRHNDLKKKINESTLAHVNADYPVLSPEGDLSVTSNITKRPKKELEDVSEAVKALPKIAKANEAGFVGSLPYRVAPILLAPLVTVFGARIVNDALKKKYAEELDSENKKIQNLQDAIDMRTLEDLQYVRKRRGGIQTTPIKEIANRDLMDVLKKSEEDAELIPKAASMDKKAAEDEENPKVDWMGALKSLYGYIPLAALVATSVGGPIYAADYFLKRTNENKKLKFLEDKVLGRNRTLTNPELVVELPKGYEENMDKKKQEQLLPGIELAEVLENPKKDAFLG